MKFYIATSNDTSADSRIYGTGDTPDAAIADAVESSRAASDFAAHEATEDLYEFVDENGGDYSSTHKWGPYDGTTWDLLRRDIDVIAENMERGIEDGVRCGVWDFERADNDAAVAIDFYGKDEDGDQIDFTYAELAWLEKRLGDYLRERAAEEASEASPAE